MDQSKSNERSAELTPGPIKSGTREIVLPKRSFSVEFFVGLFTMLGVAASGYLALGLGNLSIGASSTYQIFAEFDNISGLKSGASVEIAGVPIGEVSEIALKDPQARVTLKVENAIKLLDDDIASIRTKGIIGDRYVKISRGSSKVTIPENGTMTETESVVDIEDIIGKIVHSITGEKDEEGEKKPSEGEPAATEKEANE